MLKSLLYVAVGGGLGAIGRWWVAAWIDRPGGTTPGLLWGIFTANLIGCCLFGFFWGLGEKGNWMSDSIRLAIFTGFLGSFTTFSTFSWNTLELLKSGQTGGALLNLFLSVSSGIAGVWLGYLIATGFAR